MRSRLCRQGGRALTLLCWPPQHVDSSPSAWPKSLFEPKDGIATSSRPMLWTWTSMPGRYNARRLLTRRTTDSPAVDLFSNLINWSFVQDVRSPPGTPSIGGRYINLWQGQTNTFGTPGVAEHALFMKHVSDAMALRKKLFDQLEKASLPCTSIEEASALLHVAIVGGGPTGEACSTLANRAKITKETFSQASRLLRSFPTWPSTSSRTFTPL